MKICKYCDSENPDSVTICPSCGAHEFKYKCNNCGTVFENSNYCPCCGVKAGAEPKKCPKCGKSYFSAACPDCGFTGAKSADMLLQYSGESSNSAPLKTSYSSPNTHTSATARTKRKTWLWVLGWIFIFPVPLTVLMLRNQKINKNVKIGIIVTAWIVYLLIGLSGSVQSKSSTPTEEAQVSTDYAIEDTYSETDSDDHAEETTEITGEYTEEEAIDK